MTSGTMDATVPIEVPTIKRDSGMTMIIKIKNGTLRSRLITPFSNRITQRGSGRTPAGSARYQQHTKRQADDQCKQGGHHGRVKKCPRFLPGWKAEHPKKSASPSMQKIQPLLPTSS